MSGEPDRFRAAQRRGATFHGSSEPKWHGNEGGGGRRVSSEESPLNAIETVVISFQIFAMLISNEIT